MGMDGLRTNGSPLDFFSLAWESPLVNEIIPALASPHICFLFQLLFEMLEAVDTACLEGQCVCMALESVLHFSTAAEKWGERWLTSSRISNDVDGKPCSRWPPRKLITCWMFAVVLWCEGKVLGTDFKWTTPLRIILHFIAFCIAFYCQLDLQWENYTMLVFLFYYASVFDFPKCKKLYIALCYGRKYFLPRSIGISLQKKNRNWCSLSFPVLLHM